MILFPYPPVPFAYIGAPTKIDLWEKQEAHEIHIELSTLLQPQKWNWAGLFLKASLMNISVIQHYIVL